MTTDSNSSINQRIKGEFVKREVLACMSFEIEAVLKAYNDGLSEDLPSFDDIVNLYEYRCKECGHAVQDIGALEVENQDDPSTTAFICPNCGDSTEEEWDSEPQDILEWWLITEWLAEKLEAQGEPVLEWGNNHYWGRTCSGQAILLDGVITSICRDMGILEGQANEWKL